MSDNMKSIAKARKIGGSIVITIPSNIIKTEQIEEGEWLEIDVKKHKKSYFGALKGIGSYNREEDRMKDRE